MAFVSRNGINDAGSNVKLLIRLLLVKLRSFLPNVPAAVRLSEQESHGICVANAVLYIGGKTVNCGRLRHRPAGQVHPYFLATVVDKSALPAVGRRVGAP